MAGDLAQRDMLHRSGTRCSALGSVRVTTNAASEASDSWRVEDGVLKNLERLLCVSFPRIKRPQRAIMHSSAEYATATTSKEVKWARGHTPSTLPDEVCGNQNAAGATIALALLSGCVR